MEKSFEEVLVQFYVDQYRENAKRSTGKPVKLAHYIHRLNSKAKSIKYARFSKNETIALDKLHQEIKRLALITYYYNNKNARQILNREILPQLVRVDMEQFDENEAEYITEDLARIMHRLRLGGNEARHEGTDSLQNLGSRPTVNDDATKVTCETFIPGFSGDLYGTDPVVEFHAYLSPSKKFDTLDELRDCINNAAQRAQEYFK